MLMKTQENMSCDLSFFKHGTVLGMHFCSPYLGTSPRYSGVAELSLLHITHYCLLLLFNLMLNLPFRSMPHGKTCFCHVQLLLLIVYNLNS